MNKKEKFLNFLNNEFTNDYIPFQPILMHFAARYNGNSYSEFASDHRVLVQSNIKAMESFDLDWVELISDPYRETSAFGAKIEFITENVPRCLAPIIRNIDDIKLLKIPDIYKSTRTLDRIQGAELYQKLLKGTVPVFGWIEGPLAEACDLVGINEMLVMLMTDPDFCDLLFDKCIVVAKEFSKAQIEAGCDVIGVGDAICSQIDQDTYIRYIKERHKELIDYIHLLGGKVKMHICGNITHLLPSIKDIGLDILDIDWQVNFTDAYKFMDSNVAICGNINPVTIQDSTKSEIAQLTTSLIKDQKGKKFILSGGCEISVLTSPANLKTMSNLSRIIS
jgi:uroporphyrinogen decarboxylase